MCVNVIYSRRRLSFGVKTDLYLFQAISLTGSFDCSTAPNTNGH